MLQRSKKMIIGAVIAFILVAFIVHFWLRDYFTLESIRTYSALFKTYVEQYFFSSLFVYVILVSIGVALAVPIIMPATILAGYLYGAVVGGMVSVIAGVLGSCAVFLLVRYLSTGLHQQFGKQLKKFDEQMEKQGVLYLLMLQFSTVVPFFVINTVAGLSRISFFSFVVTTAIGISPLLFINAYAGRKLGELSSFKDVMQPQVIVLFVIFILIVLGVILIKRKSGLREW